MAGQNDDRLASRPTVGAELRCTNPSSQSEVAMRLARLERRCRRQRLLNVALTAALGAGAMLGATSALDDVQFGTVSCRRLVLVDPAGKQRVEALTMEDGTSGIRLMEESGAVRLIAYTMKSGHAGIDWLDQKGAMRVGAMTLPDGTSGIAVFDSKSVPRIEVSVSSDDVPILTQLSAPPPDPRTVPLEELRLAVEGLKAAVDADEAAVMASRDYQNQIAGQAGALGLEIRGGLRQPDLQLRERYRILRELYAERLAKEGRPSVSPAEP